MTIPAPPRSQPEPASPFQPTLNQPNLPNAPWQSPAQAAAPPPRVEPRSPYGPPPGQSPYQPPSAQDNYRAPASPYGPPPGQYGTPPNQGPYGPPPGPGPYGVMGPMKTIGIERPMSLTIILIVVALFSILTTIHSVIQSQQLSTQLGAMMPQGSAYAAGQNGGIIFWCIARLYLLFTIWNGRNWTRIAMIVISSIGCVGAILGILAKSLVGNLAWSILQLVVYAAFIVVLCLKSTGDYCRS